MIYYGKFEFYTPDRLPEGMPPELASRVLWLRNDRGEDIYELRKRLPKGHKYVITEDDGSVRIVHTDPDAVFPSEGGHLYAVEADDEAVPVNPNALMETAFDPKEKKVKKKPERPVHPESVMGKAKKVEDENKALKADVENLKEAVRLLLEREAARGKPEK